MTMPFQPTGYHSITPYLTVEDPAAAIEFYQRAFGAMETMRYMVGEHIGHAEVKIGDSHVKISGEWPDLSLVAPPGRGGTTVSLIFFVPDVDAVFAHAIGQGASEERAPADQFYGDRTATLIDPFGHRWTIATHLEEVPSDEIQRRLSAMTGS